MFFKKRSLAFGGLFIVVGLIIGLGISANFNIHSNGYSGDRSISKESIDFLSKTNEAISEVAASVKPSVVNIASTKTIKSSGRMSPFFDDPFFRVKGNDRIQPEAVDCQPDFLFLLVDEKVLLLDIKVGGHDQGFEGNNADDF